MSVYYIGTAFQWVALVSCLVWIALGVYQFTEIRMRKKVLKDYHKMWIIKEEDK